jgi:Ca2+-binding RTX toxin-like protein
MKRLLQKLFDMKTTPENKVRKPKTVSLGIEQLEGRLNPVVGNYSFAANQGLTGVGFVQGADGTAGGTCTLLSDRIHVLTAAHVVTSINPFGNGPSFPYDPRLAAKVIFADYTTGDGSGHWIPQKSPSIAIDVVAGVVPSDWEGPLKMAGVGNDIAILTLAQPAPSWVTSFDISRDTNEVGQEVELVGYGATGTGVTGEVNPSGTKYKGYNRVDEVHMHGNQTATGEDVQGGEMLQMHLHDPNNAADPGVIDEVISARGDSGGPLLLNNRIAGVCSGESSNPDPSGPLGLYGTRIWYTRVSSWANWIDRQLGQSHTMVVDATQHAFGYSFGKANYSVTINALWDNGEVRIFANGTQVDEGRAADIQSLVIRGSSVPTTVNVDSALAGRVDCDLGYTVVFDVSRQPGGTNGSRHAVQIATAGSYVDFSMDGTLFDHVDSSYVPAVAVFGSSAGDDITLSGPVPFGGIAVYTSYSANSAPDTYSDPNALTIDDSADSVAANILVGGQQVTVSSGGRTSNVFFDPVYLPALILKAGTPDTDNGNSVTVEDTPYRPFGPTYFSLYCGRKSDTVQIQGLSGESTIYGQGGQDTVTVGQNNSLANIRNSLTVTNVGGKSENMTLLNVLASADNFDHTVEIGYTLANGDYVTGLAPAPIYFDNAGVSSVHITTGSGADTFNIKSADVPMRIETGAGVDTVNVASTSANAHLYVDLGEGRNQLNVGTDYGLGAIQGTVESRAEGGSNIVYIDDRATSLASTYTLNGDIFQRDGSAPIYLADADTILFWAGQGNGNVLGAAGNTVNVLDTSGRAYTTLFTGNRDTVNVTGTTGSLFVNAPDDGLVNVNVGGPVQGLDPIQGPVWVAGGFGVNLNVDDTGSTSPQTLTIDQTTLSRSGAATIHYPYANGLDVFFQGGSGGNTINALSAPGNNLTIHSGAGNDRINIGSAANTLSNLGHFIIDGQAGNDALNLLDQGETTSQTYNFTSVNGIPVFTCPGTTIVMATMVGNTLVPSSMGTVALLGGKGGNTVQVDGTWANYKLAIDGGPGGNTISGGAGREMLIGGAGQDVLNAGSNQDILLAGNVAFGDASAELDALNAIMTEWGRTDVDYATRADHLLHGGGLNGATLLNPATYLGDAGGNSMIGGADLDLFFGSLASDASTFDSASGAVFVDPQAYMVSVPINVAAMTGTTLFLDGNALVDGMQSVDLTPGQHVLSTDRGVSAAFNVGDDGTITYDPSLEGALSGNSGKTLMVQVAILDPAQASQLMLTCPSTTMAAADMALTLTVTDDLGNVATGYTGTVHVASTDASFLPFDYTFAAADQGQATIQIMFNTVGTQILMATDTDASLSAAATVNVAPAAANLVVNAPTASRAGKPISVTVKVFDTTGNIATGFLGTVHVTSTDPALQPLDYTFVASDSGQHTFSLPLVTAGTQTITVATPGLISVSKTIAISPATKNKLVFASAASTSTTAGATLGAKVFVEDKFGNVIRGDSTDVIKLTSNIGGLHGMVTATVHAGVGTFAGLSLTRAGATTLTASAIGLSSAASTIIVTPASPSRFLLSGLPASIYPGQIYNITVTVVDAYHNVIPGALANIHFSSSDVKASLPSDTTLSGSQSFSVVFRTKGTQILRVTDSTGKLIGRLIVAVL